jgi:hypothetical protein
MSFFNINTFLKLMLQKIIILIFKNDLIKINALNFNLRRNKKENEKKKKSKIRNIKFVYFFAKI